MSSYLTEAMVYERIDRYQTEAAGHRRTKSARPEGPGAIDRIMQAIERGVAAIAEPLKVDRRPRIPAI
jgi:hypothetical protein